MEIKFAPKGRLEINGAKIIWRNFAGRKDEFNTEGKRKFSIIIPNEDLANQLTNDGWNVRIKAPKEEGDDPFMYMDIKVNVRHNDPKVYLDNGSGRATIIPTDLIDQLDELDIAYVDLDINPYEWEMRGRTGRSAYLKCLYVYQNTDRFAMRMAADESPEE